MKILPPAGAILAAMQRQGTSYRIVVRGRMSERFASGFTGMTAEPCEGATALVGDVVDQSQLFGLLERVHSLGLELVRVEVVCK